MSSIKAAVRREVPSAVAFAFGSAFSGFRIKTSIVDVSVIVGPEIARSLLGDRQLDKATTDFELLDKVIIPALGKDGFREIKRTQGNDVQPSRVLMESPCAGERVVVYANEVLPLISTKLLRQYSLIDGRAQNLGLLIRYWASRRGLLDPSGCSHGLSGFAWIVLVIFYLQASAKVVPSLQQLAVDHERAVRGPTRRTLSWQAEAPSWRDLLKVHSDGTATNLSFVDAESYKNVALESDATLAGLLRGFFVFYSSRFNWSSEVVTMSGGRRCSRSDRSAPCFVENPMQTGANIAQGVTSTVMEEIKGELARAAGMVEQNTPLKTIFGPRHEECEPETSARPATREELTAADDGAMDALINLCRVGNAGE